MNRADIAERILRLAASPEHAAALAGDLIEDQTVGRFRFWIAVLQTAIAQSFRRIVATPGAVVSAGIGWAAAEWIATVVLCTAWLGCDTILREDFHTGLPHWALVSVFWLLANLAVPLSLGSWIARRARNSPGSVILTLATMHASINLLAALASVLLGTAGFDGTIEADGIPAMALMFGVRAVFLHGSIFYSAAWNITAYPLLVSGGAAVQGSRLDFHHRHPAR